MVGVIRRQAIFEVYKRRRLLGGVSNVMPAPDEPLLAGDRLIVAGMPDTPYADATSSV